MRALGKIGPGAKAAVPALINALRNDANNSLRQDAARALGQIGPEASAAIPVLIRWLKDGDENDRRAALFALRDFGPEAKSAVPVLLDLLANEKEYDSNYNAARLAAVGPGASGAAPTLIALSSARVSRQTSHSCWESSGRRPKQPSRRLPKCSRTATETLGLVPRVPLSRSDSIPRKQLLR